MKAVRLLALFAWAMSAGAQTVHRSPEIPKFMGREVVLYDPGLRDEPGIFPNGPAKVCVEGPPREQCYTAPQDFGSYPTLEFVQLSKGVSALFFEAAGGGVSGFPIHFALLVPDAGNALQDLLLADVTVSNQSQHAFWTEPTISDAKLFLTADVVWGPEEVHFGDHRYMISVYLRAPEDPSYWLGDRYMTTRKYDLGTKADVLQSERQEILARLRRAVAAQRPR